MMFKSVTILGGRGMLGSDLAIEASKRGLSVMVHDLPEFDLSNEAQVEEMVSVSEVIINCAAYTNVEKAESDMEIANQINGYAVGRLGQIAKEEGVPIIHISTDFVFDGRQTTPYVETDDTRPISVYGSSKLLGERLLAESACEHCVVRVQWTYGEHGVNFITKILDASQVRDELKVVDDQIGSPTHTAEVARVLCEMLLMPVFPQGVYHLASNGYVSRYEMTRYLFDKLGIETPVKPCQTSDFKTAAERPLSSRFNCEKIEQLLGRKLNSWQRMLDTYLETILKGS